MAATRQATSKKVPRGIRTPQQARSRRTRDRIVAAAIAAFEADGYDDTTTAAIARRAGIGVGTLYAYFPDKRKLMLEILDGTVRAMSDMVADALAPERWREGDHRAHVRAVIDAVMSSRLISPGIQRILWERHLRDPEFRDAVLAIEHRLRGALERLFAELKKQGVLRPIAPHAAAFVVHAAIEWISSRLVLGEADVPHPDVVEAATDMVSRYLFDERRVR
ncbi:MAG TPA: TetR/AcrR family transcriptional regulator [Candidatus Binatia bacterium]